MNISVCPIIGMSPGNSYFTQERIKELLKRTSSQYQHSIIFIPDIPAIHTYRSFGYPDNLARQKAITKGNNLKNRARRAIDELSLDIDQITIIDWNRDVKDCESYNAERLAILSLYNVSESFRHDARETTGALLVHSGRTFESYEAAIDEAVQYLLDEFAFIQFIRKDQNYEYVKYIYHKPWPVYERYIAGEYDNILKPELQFEVSSAF